MSYNAAAVTPTPRGWIFFEARVFWRVIRSDWTTALLPGVVFSLLYWLCQRLPLIHWTELLSVFSKSILYFACYAHSFCLSNQIVGVEEDRSNNKDRPLPKGEISMQGAWNRWVLSVAVYLCVGWWLGVTLLTLGWVAVSIAHNLLGGAKHWLIKNLCNGVGVYIALNAARVIASLSIPMEQNEWVQQSAKEWINFLSLAIFVLIPLQDLRDVKGDQESGRQTFPLQFGIVWTRRFLGYGFLALSGIAHLGLKMYVESPHILWMLLDFAQVVLCVVIAFRVVWLKNSPKQDDFTYKLFAPWFLVMILAVPLNIIQERRRKQARGSID